MEQGNEQARQIIHVDMDAFFAAVEQRDQPELLGKPVLVGGDPGGRGVVSAASYEARPFGCRSAMPTARAIRLCPQAIVVRPRMARYAEASRQVFEVFERFTPLIEPLSIDEAFLDVTGSVRLFGSAERIARMVKEQTRAHTGLTASAGVASNKFLAKLASDMDKPNGLVVVHADRIRAFLDPIPIGCLWGVGKATLPKLTGRGIHTFGDARRLSPEQWHQWFGDSGTHFHRLVRGLDDRAVVPDREAKSISHEVTFPVDVSDREHLRAVLLDQLDQVARRLRGHELVARTVMLKVRSPDFHTITRNATLANATDRTDILWHAVSRLFATWSRQHTSAVRLIGVGVSRFPSREGEQMTLFEPDEEVEARRLDHAMDEIRDRFGKRAVFRAGALRKRNT